MTFADLATLLLTFFILLLSFSQIDAQKYREIANSMANAFGVPTIQGPVTVVTKVVEVPVPAVPTVPAAQLPATPEPAKLESSVPPAPVLAAPSKDIENLAYQLFRELETEAADKRLNVDYDDKAVTIRFSNDATFSSGNAELNPEMLPILDKIARAAVRCPGQVMVAGYTDDQPITGRYRSNWDLSAARAVSVVHRLLQEPGLDPDKVMASGHADSHPLAPNDTEENRAINRRVEIRIANPQCLSPATGG